MQKYLVISYYGSVNFVMFIKQSAIGQPGNQCRKEDLDDILKIINQNLLRKLRTLRALFHFVIDYSP